LDALPEGLPVLLDGAQGVGAVSFDVTALGCAFYAGSGQKWLCGPVGTGMLWVAPAWRERLTNAGPTYMNLEVPADGLQARPHTDARAHDGFSMSLETVTAALAAHDTLAAFGHTAVHERARGLAAELAERLAAAGHEVAPRGDTTLVSWLSDDAAAESARLLEAGVMVRSFAGLPYVRASVGAWNDHDDIARLLDGAGG
ncbi:MAG: L-cysteine/cystine lyase, partial [Solirubrobacteraceae bacterium]|nr:L-cysteine/cystine lyase [Solirubrobacteraceae bacterium]